MPETNYKFDLSAVLARTPEEMKEDASLQAEARDRLSHLVGDSPALAHYRTAVGAEKAVIEEITRLEAQLLENVAGCDYLVRAKTANERIDAGCDRLAEICFWQGKFAAAVDIAKNLTKKNEYLKFKIAYLNLDAPLCSCTTVQFASKHSAKGNSVPAKREIQRVYVGQLEKEVKFIKCEKCGWIFAETAL